MKKIIITALVLSTPMAVQASDDLIAGARYAAQGNTLTANANDSFALTVNPANLLSHGQGHYSEVVVDFASYLQQEDDSTEFSQTPLLQYIGGYITTDSFVYGLYISSIKNPIYVQNAKTGSLVGIDRDQIGLSIAWGNILDADTDEFFWGIGGSLEVIEGKDKDNLEKVKDESCYTISAKLGHHSTLVLDHNAIDFIVNVAVSYSDEAINKAGFYEATTLRPETTRFGLSTVLANSSESFSWDLTLSGEYVSQQSSIANTLSPLPIVYGDELRLGAEYVLVQPFGWHLDMAVRTGLIMVDDTSSTTLASMGVGFSNDNWAIDISSQESAIFEKEQQYNLTISYRF